MFKPLRLFLCQGLRKKEITGRHHGYQKQKIVHKQGDRGFLRNQAKQRRCQHNAQIRKGLSTPITDWEISTPKQAGMRRSILGKTGPFPSPIKNSAAAQAGGDGKNMTITAASVI